MMRTPFAEIQVLADKFQRPAYLVRVTDSASGREFCEEECFTTDKQEADSWAKQWKGEYSKEDGYNLTRRTFQPAAKPETEEQPSVQPRTPIDWAFHQRAALIGRIRLHAAALRSKPRNAQTVDAYRLLRARGMTAIKAYAMLKAIRPASVALAVWNSPDVTRETARRVAVEAAAYELADYLKFSREEIEDPRKAFRSMYGINRMAPAFVAACR
jgi:hypothetical protein